MKNIGCQYKITELVTECEYLGTYYALCKPCGQRELEKKNGNLQYYNSTNVNLFIWLTLRKHEGAVRTVEMT